MASDDSTLIEALRRAVEDHPEDNEIRAHLAELLAGADRGAEALDQCSLVLGRDPAHRRALEVGVVAATAVGEVDRAQSYRRLLDVLGHASDGVDAAATRVPAVPAHGSGPDDEFAVDAFLEEVLGDASAGGSPPVTLDDVGGLVEVKRRLRTSFLGPIGNPELREMYGTSLRGGLLMYGPPGCGKTFLARALAGELGARFYGIGIHDVLDMWMGNSERNLHALFEHARRTAPSVLFFDEVDALGQKRSQLVYSSARNVVVQLLSELDGIGDVNDGVFILAATNQPWDVDSALRRPGRLDRTMLVLPPDLEARMAILDLHLRTRPVDRLDIASVAAATEGYSGADLRLVCNAAAETALADSIESGVARPITQEDLDHALRESRPSTSEWFLAAKNYAMFANDDGTYDDLLAYIRAHRLG
jgi:AAA+ superfamily predicted ATPase